MVKKVAGRAAPSETDRIMRRREVCKVTGLSPSALYSEEAAGRFPKRVRISLRAVGWFESDVVDWLDRRRVAVGA